MLTLVGGRISQRADRDSDGFEQSVASIDSKLTRAASRRLCHRFDAWAGENLPSTHLLRRTDSHVG